MALPQGINMRNTSGFVTDPANYDYAIPSRHMYPFTSAQGNNCGYETEGGTFSNDNSSYDARIAGFARAGGNFRIDLPSTGSYRIGYAGGYQFHPLAVDVDLYDGASLLAALSTGSTSAGNRYNDATDTEYTNATWPSSQSYVTHTFATQIARWSPTDENQYMNSVYIEAADTPRRWILGRP